MIAGKKHNARIEKSQIVKSKRIESERKASGKPHSSLKEAAALTVDRRASRDDRRSTPDRRVQEVKVTVERRTLERRVKVNRRRQIDPTTCERDYTPDEIEFMSAMDEYKRCNGRMFPTCSEILEVIKSLGYQKTPKAAESPLPGLDLPHPTDSSQAVVCQGV